MFTLKKVSFKSIVCPIHHNIYKININKEEGGLGNVFWTGQIILFGGCLLSKRMQRSSYIWLFKDMVEMHVRPISPKAMIADEFMAI